MVQELLNNMLMLREEAKMIKEKKEIKIAIFSDLVQSGSLKYLKKKKNHKIVTNKIKSIIKHD